MFNCKVCGKTTETSTALTATTGASSLTFSQVLDKLVKEEQLTQAFKNIDFSNGNLCRVCKYFVSTLDRLQKDLVEVKTLILSLFKNEYFELTSDNAAGEKEKAEVLHQPKALGMKKKSGSTERKNISETPSLERIVTDSKKK